MNCKIGIVGCGNLAFHLVKKLENSTHPVLFVFHPDNEKARLFSKEFKQLEVVEENTFPDLDILICAVSDSSMFEVLSFYSKHYFCVSTSGTFDVAEINSENTSTLYPLQTFNKLSTIEFEEIPLFIEVSIKNKEKLICLANLLSSNIHFLNAKQRQKLHVSAVFANNFSNHFFDISEQYCKDNDLDFSWIIPLIKQSVNQLGSISPKDLQTGPAKRNDNQTIDKHLELLPENLKDIYQIVTKSIKNRFQNND
jgi:hypothetical protein